MALIEMSLKELEYERLKDVLIELKSLAKNVYLYEDSLLDTPREIAKHDKQEIIDILLALEI